MVALANLQSASFRGARFLCPKDTASEGRNSIEHKYPDRDQRFVEDNGYLPPEFTITAVLHGPSLLSDFQALRAALNRPGPGTLHHPYYGAQLCSVKGPWKVQREDTDSGVLTLDITFLVTGPAIFPAVAVSIPAVVSGLAGSFIGSALQAFTQRYGAPEFSETSREVVAKAVTDTAASFSDLTAAPDVSLAVNHLLDNPERFIDSGADLAGELAPMFRGAFDDTTYSGEAIVRTLRKVDTTLAGVHADGLAIVPDTVDYAVRRGTLLTYSTFCRCVTLASMAEAMAGTTYITADAVHAAQTLLLDTYAEIDLDMLDTETGEGIKAVVGAALGVLRGEELQLPRIEAEPLMAGMPASVLAYLLYEDDARTTTVVDLNMYQNPILLERSANILTGVA